MANKEEQANMANKEERANMTSASMVELKAELSRKQEEFRLQKATGNKFLRKLNPDKGDFKHIFNRKNKGVENRAQKDKSEEQSTEEEDTLIKSRQMLEEKSKLYAEMTSGTQIPDEDGSEYYLVDFQKKAIDSIVEERNQRRKQEEIEEEEAERKALEEAVPPPSTPGEEWIDYTDSLGRSRRCLKQDLDYLKKQDKSLTNSRGEPMASAVVSENASLMSDDMYREKMRKKWEAEMQDLIDKDQKDLHYSNVRFDEKRTHGVGFYQFSKDAEAREKEMENLKKMREETLGSRSRQVEVKDKRRAAMEARLAKVRQRRGMQAPVVESKTEPPELKDTEEVIKKEQEMEKKNEEKKRVEIEAEEKRKAHIREWDKDKKKDLAWSHNNYMESRRKERDEQFAPPAVYFNNTGPKNLESKKSTDEERMLRLEKSFLGVKEKLDSSTSSLNEKLTKHEPFERKKLVDPPTVGMNKDNLHKKDQPINKGFYETAEVNKPKLDISSIPLPSSNEPTSLTRSLKKEDVNSNTPGQCFSKSLSYTRNSVHQITPPIYTNIALEPFRSNEQCNDSEITTVPVNQTSFQPTPYNLYNNPLPNVQNQNYLNTDPSSYPTQLQNINTGCCQQPVISNEEVSVSLESTEAKYNYLTHHTDNTKSIETSETNYHYAPNYPSQNPNYKNACAAPLNYLSSTSSKNTDSFKRGSDSHATKTINKVPKMHKLDIVDSRYVQNEEDDVGSVENLPDERDPKSEMSAVPYTPGSFSAAQHAAAVAQHQDCGGPPASQDPSAAISSRPVLYTAQQQQQQRELEALEALEQQQLMDDKVADFLTGLS